MQLNLSRPLAFFDLETTGINTGTDRIIEIAILKIFPDNHKESLVKRVNPTIPIPAGASRIHGIYDKDVVNEPTFVQIAPSIHDFFSGADLAGFNSNRFDIPMLVEEFLRAGIVFDFESRQRIDVLGIFHKMEQRNLKAAYKFYCGKDLDAAHQAEADVLATYEVMLAQLEKYDELKNDVEYLHQFTASDTNVDLAGKIIRNEKGKEVFSFGKYRGQWVGDVFRTDPSYYKWMLTGDFSQQTKNVITMLKEKYIGKLSSNG